MIPLLVFLLACAAVYLGTILAAFSALMRFSLRMLAESTAGPRDVLTRFLEDPAALFFPARLLLGLVTALTAVLLAELENVGETAHGIWLFLGSMVSFVIVCFHVGTSADRSPAAAARARNAAAIVCGDCLGLWSDDPGDCRNAQPRAAGRRRCGAGDCVNSRDRD